MMKWTMLIFTLTSLLASNAVAGDRNALHLEGEILLSDSTPVVSPSVSFLVKIYDETQSCVLWSEQQILNMSGTAGAFNLDLGASGNRLTGVANFADVFSNRLIHGATADCLSGYNGGGTNRDRYLELTFNDGNGPVTLNTQVIKSSAFAMDSARVGGYQASDFLLLTGLPTCAAGTFLTWSGSAFSCGTPSGGGGTVTSITSANAYLTVAGTASTPQLTVNVGTAAGTVAAGDDSRFANISNASLLTGTLPVSVLPSFSGDVTSTAGSTTLTLSNIGTAGTYYKVTTDSKGRVTSGGALGTSDITTALGYTPIDPANLPANCSAGETLTFSSPSGAWLCSTIQVTAASFSSQAASAVLVAPSAASGVPTFRNLTADDLPGSGTAGVFKQNGNAFSGDANLGTTGATNLNLISNGGVRATISAAGKVGIATSAPETTLDVNGLVTLQQAYFEKFLDLGTFGTPCTTTQNIANFSANIFVITPCGAGTTTMDIPSATGMPSGLIAWNATFFVTGQTGSVFNISYEGSGTNVYWDKHSTNGVGGNNYTGFAVDSGATSVINCVVLKRTPVKVYCSVGAQY